MHASSSRLSAQRQSLQRPELSKVRALELQGSCVSKRSARSLSTAATRTLLPAFVPNASANARRQYASSLAVRCAFKCRTASESHGAILARPRRPENHAQRCRRGCSSTRPLALDSRSARRPRGVRFCMHHARSSTADHAAAERHATDSQSIAPSATSSQLSVVVREA